MPSLSAQAFFEAKTRDGIALTFDDIQVETGYADFLPGDICIAGKFSRNVPLLVPVVGAAMSTVVHAPMAIALAKFGGIGSVPRSFDPDAQAREVARVKNNIHGFTDNPVPAQENETVERLLQRRREKGWEFDSFPVIDKNKKLVGLITHQNFKRTDDHSMKIGAVMTKLADLYTAKVGVSKQEAYQLLKQHDKNVLPVLNPDGTLAGIYVYSDLKRILTEKTNHNVDAQGRLRVCAAIGVGEEALRRAELLVTKGCDVFHIDMAHGHQKVVIDTVRLLKQRFRNGPDIVAGNISNREAARALLDAGADGILVGQGGGAICTTRRITGIGKPQVSAVWECMWELRKDFSDVPICSDGGIRGSGDILKALAAGAKSVMVGNLLAGTDEAPGEKHFYNGRYVKDFYGMGSLRAMKESPASRQRYSHTEGVLVPEGVEAVVPYKGPVRDILEQQVGGLRKGFLDCGAKTLAQLQDKAKFFQVTAAGVVESHPHDVTITAEAPNYSRM
ncbi:MAG TPA: IMP dehydrogenase [Candidatus Paceibacterota bacterium]|nr:IMP dehydrogenase [Candidatus Paceibacterota bacterium]